MNRFNRVISLVTGPAKKYFIPILLGLALTFGLFWAYLSKPPSVEHLGDLVFDAYQRAIPREYNHEGSVRIIDIDDESLERIGQWPWPRTTVAKLHDRLGQAGAALVAYDIVFAEADRTSPENVIEILESNPQAGRAELRMITNLKSHDAILAESFNELPVVGGVFLVNNETSYLPDQRFMTILGGNPTEVARGYKGMIASRDILRENMLGQGSVSFNPGADGIIRNAPLIAGIGDNLYPSLSLEALRAVMDENILVRTSSASAGLTTTGAGANFVEMIKVGDFVVPTTEDGSLRVYYTRDQPSRYIPAWVILSDEIPMSEWENDVGGHIVFIGTGALGLKDLRATPMNPAEPGVLIHAQVVEQIIEEKFLQRPYWVVIIEVWAIILTGLILSFSLPFLTAARGLLLTTAAGVTIILSSIYAFKTHLFLINPVYTMLTLLLVYLAITLASFYLTETERSRIRNAFSMYLSPTMVKKVSDDPDLLKLGGEERDMTVLFLDIRSFSKISEGMKPQDITTFLNIFLTPMTNIIQDNQGTIDKYIGDAIVAFWNAPLDDEDHHENAARSVVKMHKELAKLNKKYADHATVQWPQNVRIGIGLNTGICCVGNLGSEQRFSYSMIGDAVNLAARIEGLTKQYGVGTLIGNTTAKQLGDFALLEADLIRVVGRRTPERIFILLGDEKMTKSSEFKKLLEQHDAFLTAYRNQSWAKAIKLCNALQPIGEELGTGFYYDIMRERIEVYKAAKASEALPKNWNGVYIARSK